MYAFVSRLRVVSPSEKSELYLSSISGYKITPNLPGDGIQAEGSGDRRDVLGGLDNRLIERLF